MTQREMFEKCFERPKNFDDLTHKEQWAIDKRLGILDWEAKNLSEEDIERYHAYFNPEE